MDDAQPQGPSKEVGLEGNREQLPETKPRPEHPTLPETNTQGSSKDPRASRSAKLGSNPFDGLTDMIQMATAVEPPGDEQFLPMVEAAIEELHEADAPQFRAPEDEPLPERPRAAACPYLGATEDAKKGALGPDSMRSCFAARQHRPVTVSHQVRYCLSLQHMACETYCATQDGIRMGAADDRPAGKNLLAFLLRLFGLR